MKILCWLFGHKRYRSSSLNKQCEDEILLFEECKRCDYIQFIRRYKVHTNLKDAMKAASE